MHKMSWKEMHHNANSGMRGDIALYNLKGFVLGIHYFMFYLNLLIYTSSFEKYSHFKTLQL